MIIPKNIESKWLKYNELKDSGLKKEANSHLQNIVDTIDKNGLASYKDFLFSLCDEGLSDDYTKKIQYPIFVKCILPLLVEGLKANSVRETLFIVKANLHGYGHEVFQAIGDNSNEEHLKKVLLLQPKNKTAVNLLASDYVETLYYGAHHLPDGLILELKIAKAVIQESTDFIKQNSSLIDKKLTKAQSYYVSLYSDYETWKMGSYEYNFQQWCEKNKKEYHWVKSYYYE